MYFCFKIPFLVNEGVNHSNNICDPFPLSVPSLHFCFARSRELYRSELGSPKGALKKRLGQKPSTPHDPPPHKHMKSLSLGLRI